MLGMMGKKNIFKVHFSLLHRWENSELEKDAFTKKHTHLNVSISSHLLMIINAMLTINVQKDVLKRKYCKICTNI